MGKKDARREYYQVEEARRKRRMNCATRGEARVCDEESAECGASEAGRMKLFVRKGFKDLESRG